MHTSIPKVGFVSLGCPKALVDSERIITQLRAEGYAIAPSYEGSDVVVVNTCGFIDEAIEESLDAIGEALAQNGKVIVTGCLGAKGDIVARTFPNVLAVTGPHDTKGVLAAVRRHLPPGGSPFASLVPPQGLKLTPAHYAYVKIAEGCNHSCTFCIIPSMRGPLQSRPAGDVLQEAERLVAAGVQELLIIAQDTSAYGADLRYRTDFWRGKPVRSRLPELCRALAELGVWVRLHYVYPYPHVDELIPLMTEGLLLPYLDVPLQHASPRVLRAMKRPADSEDALARIHAWRQSCPEITLRSTFIVGFPGETDEDFAQLLAFLEEAELDRVGCFPYSPVAGAVANRLSNPVPEALKQERLEQFMLMQAQISARRLRRRVGREIAVLVDGHGERGAIARSSAEAPEVDGCVIIEGEAALELNAGDLAQVRIIDSDDHDLRATLV